MGKAAAKTRCFRKPRSAVFKVKKSGFDLVRSKPHRGCKKPASMAQLGKIQWKPWRRTADMEPTELIPSDEQMCNSGVGCRMAYALMLMPRKKLIAMHGNVDHAHVDQLMVGLAETAEWLKAMAYMIDTAYLRVLASAAAAHKQGTKFKGV